MTVRRHSHGPPSSTAFGAMGPSYRVVDAPSIAEMSELL
jgi:hypothetical protein